MKVPKTIKILNPLAGGQNDKTANFRIIIIIILLLYKKIKKVKRLFF